MSIASDNPGWSPIVRWLLLTGLGYAVLFFVSLWIPIGLHRIVMGRVRDWWHWPVSYAALASGAAVWSSTGRHPRAVVSLLGGGAWWFSLLLKDLFTMWTWHWPFAWTIGAELD